MGLFVAATAGARTQLLESNLLMIAAAMIADRITSQVQGTTIFSSRSSSCHCRSLPLALQSLITILTEDSQCHAPMIWAALCLSQAGPKQLSPSWSLQSALLLKNMSFADIAGPTGGCWLHLYIGRIDLRENPADSTRPWHLSTPPSSLARYIQVLAGTRNVCHKSKETTP